MAENKSSLEERINEVWDIAVFWQLMSAFVEDVDWRLVKEETTKIYDFLKTAHEDLV